jgi:hypothetical protein
LSASFRRDGHAIFGDSRGAEAFVEYHVAAFGAQCDFYGVGEDVPPRSMRCRPSTPNLTFLAAMLSDSS